MLVRVLKRGRSNRIWKQIYSGSGLNQSQELWNTRVCHLQGRFSQKALWEKRSPTVLAWSSKAGSLELLSGDKQKQLFKLRKMENLPFPSILWIGRCKVRKNENLPLSSVLRIGRCPSTLMKGTLHHLTQMLTPSRTHPDKPSNAGLVPILASQVQSS